MSETKSSTPQKTVPSADGHVTTEDLRKMTPAQLLTTLADAWNKAIKLRNDFNRRVYETDEKVQELVRRYKEFEDNIKDVNDKDFFVTDLLDPKVSDLLIAVEDGTYQRPAEKTVYDFLHSDTMFETIIGEILLRRRPDAPAPSLKD